MCRNLHKLKQETTFPRNLGKVNVKRGKLNGKTRVPKTRNLAHGGTYRKGRRRGAPQKKAERRKGYANIGAG